MRVGGASVCVALWYPLSLSPSLSLFFPFPHSVRSADKRLGRHGRVDTSEMWATRMHSAQKGIHPPLSPCPLPGSLASFFPPNTGGRGGGAAPGGPPGGGGGGAGAGTD